MQTRSKVSLQNISINELVKEPITKKTIPAIIKRYKKLLSNIKDDMLNKSSETFILFDIESFEVTINDNSDLKKWIPHQIAWGIYSYNPSSKTLDCKATKNYYVAELWIEEKYRNEIKHNFETACSTHLTAMKNTKYPIKSSINIIKEMIEDMKVHNVGLLAAYNISSDFKSLKLLYEKFSSNETFIDDKLFNIKYSNPFRLKSIDYIDLMHNSAILYMDYLITEGFTDKKIFRNGNTNYIKLKGRDDTKSIYSAEYIIGKFFSQKQLHLAHDDVKLESLLLEKMLNDHGIDAIEKNVMYPTDLYQEFSRKINENYGDKIEIDYVDGDKNKKSRSIKGNTTQTAVSTNSTNNTNVTNKTPIVKNVSSNSMSPPPSPTLSSVVMPSKNQNTIIVSKSQTKDLIIFDDSTITQEGKHDNK